MRLFSIHTLLFLIFLLLSNSTSGKRFEESHLGSHPPFHEPVTFRDIDKRNLADISEWSCMKNTAAAHHNVNKWADDVETNRSVAFDDPNFLRGTTIWVNEHLAVGHMMYDLYMIQLLQVIPIDRIIHQRAPCTNPNLCAGTSTWDGWYMGFFMAMFEAFQPEVPVYIRFTWQERAFKPLYLSPREPTGFSSGPKEKEHAVIPVTQTKCFERLIRRRCNPCFHNGLSLSAVRAFKSAAYSLVKTNPKPTTYFTANEPIVVTFSYRGKTASRHIDNIDFVLSTLRGLLQSDLPQVRLQVYPSTNDSVMYYDQIDLAARTHVMITEHGAFQSNVIYMRRGALMIDLRGSYKHTEYVNFEIMARIFEVHFAHVVTQNLEWHSSNEFNVSMQELQQVVGIVKEYVQEKPYLVNINQQS